ncbi:MAG: tetratricopeptide repeat protein [Parvularculaceae bacterium]|nr:tetratricopeptide repeat protein [Parvularculaceae bacterium]
MTNDDTILREVDQALAEDKTTTEFKKHLPLILGVAVVAIASVGGFQVWKSNRDAAAAKASAAYEQASKAGEGEEAEKALEALAAGEGGYAVVATMRLAGEHASHGESDKALALFRDVYASSNASKRIKDLARIRAAYLSISEGRDAVIKDIGALETDASPLGFYAREILALGALKAADYQTAETMFLKSAADLGAPEPVRARAKEFAALAAAGKSGVTPPSFEASTKSDAELLMEQLEAAGSDLSSIIAPQADEPAPPVPEPQPNE